MNQNERGRFWIAGFLVVNAYAVNVNEARMLGMKHDVADLSQSASRGRTNSLPAMATVAAPAIQ